MTKTNKYLFRKTCPQSSSFVNFKFTILPGIYNPNGSSAGEFNSQKQNVGQYLKFMYQIDFAGQRSQIEPSILYTYPTNSDCSFIEEGYFQLNSTVKPTDELNLILENSYSSSPTTTHFAAIKELLHFEGGSSLAMLNNSIIDFESSDLHTGPLMNNIRNIDG